MDDAERRVARELMLAYVAEQRFLKQWFITGPATPPNGCVAFCRECTGKGEGRGHLGACDAVKHEPWCLTPLAVAAERAENLTPTNPG